MGTFYINVEECYKTSRELSTASLKLAGEAVKISELKNSLDMNYIELYNSLETLEQNTRNESLYLFNAGEALFQIAKTYEQAELNILSNLGVPAPIRPTLGVDNEAYERLWENTVDFLKEHWENMLYTLGTYSISNLVEKLLSKFWGQALGYTFSGLGAIWDMYNMYKQGKSIEEILIKGGVHLGVGIAAGAAAGAIVGSVFPGIGTVAGAIVGGLIAVAISEPINAIFDYVYDNYGDEIADFFRNFDYSTLACDVANTASNAWNAVSDAASSAWDAVTDTIGNISIPVPSIPTLLGPNIGTVFG